MAIVYRHRNPNTLEVFYVGVSKCDSGKRAYKMSQRNKYWHNYVNKYGMPTVEILYKNIPYEDALELEIFLIEEYGRRLNGSGSLTNISLGGDDNSGENNGMYKKGYLISGDKHPFYGKEPPFKGRVHKKESIIKMSNSSKGKLHSQETKDKISKKLTGRKLSKSAIEKISGKNSYWYNKGHLLRGGNNPNAKIVLDLSTGIFYDSLKEASFLYNYSYSYLKSMLNNGVAVNKTTLVYC